MTINLKVPDITELKPRITVIGAGGAGGNAVNNMIAAGLKGVQFVVANTDAQALAMSKADKRVQMGANVTEGLGAGAKPEIGAAAAEEALDEIRGYVSGAHMVFITAGMGGGTGTGAAPIIARAAKEEGILTVGVVTKPFSFEGARRMRTADVGIAELEKYVDTLLVIPNQNLFRVATEKTTFADAFALADQVLHSGIACITDLMVKEGLINLDFADVRTIMKGMGKAMMGTGQASGDNRAIAAAESAISNPLLDDVSMKGASGLLISITGGNDLTLYEVDEAASRIREEVDQEANIILGATFDETLNGQVRVSVVATGLDNRGAKAAQPEAGRPDLRAVTLSERIANLQQQQAAQGNLPARMPQQGQPQQGGVWQGPGNVTIEKQVRQVALPSMAPQGPAPAQNFVAQAPSMANRPVRRMPNMDELPRVAQNEIRARQGGVPQQGLHAQTKKVGFFERLTGMGRSRTEQKPEIRRQREPSMQGGRPMPQAGPQVARPPMQQSMPQPALQPVPQRAPQPPHPVQRPQMPQQPPVRHAMPQPAAGGESGAPSKARLMRSAGVAKPTSPAPVAQMPSEEDLEIPAFLKRQAN